MLLRKNRSQYPLLVVTGDKRGQRTETLYLETVWEVLYGAGQIVNYLNK